MTYKNLSLGGVSAALVLLVLAACGGAGGGGADDAGASVADVDDDGRVEAQAAAKPVITSQPADTTAVVGRQATFRVDATGGYPMTYQWRKNGKVIAGATASSYTTRALNLAADDDEYRVTVKDPGGSRVSRSARLSVTASASSLARHTWSKGKLLSSGDETVRSFTSAMDDAGRVMVVYVQSDGTRNVIHATRGTPGAKGVAPSWSAPVKIDVRSGVPVGLDAYNYGPFAVAVSPNGNAFVTWVRSDPCSPSSYYGNAGSRCQYLYGARFLASTGKWERPAQIVDTPGSYAVPRINADGDVAVLYTGWARGANIYDYSRHPAVVWRASGAADYSNRVFIDAVGASVSSNGDIDLGLDKAGRMIVVGQADQHATVDIVAYHGKIGGEFGAQVVLDKRSSAATFKRLAVGVQGQAVAIWTQNNGVSATHFAATLAKASGGWSVSDLGSWQTYDSQLGLTVTDAGEALLYDFDHCRFRRWSAAAWSSVQSLPSACAVNYYYYATGIGLARNGDYVATSDRNADFGSWALYDADRNTLVETFGGDSPGSGYVFGFISSQINASAYSGKIAVHLSPRGVGAYILNAPFDTLPTPSQPAGDGRPGVSNVWGLFLKSRQ